MHIKQIKSVLLNDQSLRYTRNSVDRMYYTARDDLSCINGLDITHTEAKDIAL